MTYHSSITISNGKNRLRLTGKQYSPQRHGDTKEFSIDFQVFVSLCLSGEVLTKDKKKVTFL